MEYLEIPCSIGQTQTIKVKSTIFMAKSAYQEIAIYDSDDFGRCLFLDSDIQCSEKDHDIYDTTLLRKLRPEDRNMLIIGGGDGYVAETALRHNPHLTITIVDLDPAVVDACRQHLSQRIFEDSRVTLVAADALQYMKNAGVNSYDGIVCDLTNFPVGYNDGKFASFYATVLPLARTRLKKDSWISVYAGSSSETLSEMMTEHFGKIASTEIDIPSFGESCCFLFGENTNSKK